MCDIYVLNDSVIFWPEQNLLTDMPDNCKKVQLTGPAARCLELLIVRKSLVSHKDLYEYAWQGSGFVPSPNTLYQSISVLRRAFREICETEIDYVITETRKGFKLNPKVSILAKKQEITDGYGEKKASGNFDQEKNVEPIANNIMRFSGFGLIGCILFSVVISVGVTFGMYKPLRRGNSLFENYSGPFYIPGNACKFFLSPRNDRGHLNALNLSFLQCNHEHFIYITILPYSPDISIISCDRVINMHPKKCETMILRDKNDF